MRTLQASTIMLLSAALFALPAAAQKGMGEPTGVARQAVKPPIETLSGTIKDIKIGACERTTGRSLVGVHLVVQAENDKAIDLHLGPEGALENVVDQLSVGQPITFEAFRTDLMPEGAYVAKSLKVGNEEFDLRDDNLRPNWAIAARGGGRGMGAGKGQGRGAGPGTGAGKDQALGAGPAAGRCYW